MAFAKTLLALALVLSLGRAWLQLCGLSARENDTPVLGQRLETLAVSWLLGCVWLGWLVHMSVLLLGRVPVAIWWLALSVLVLALSRAWRQLLTFATGFISIQWRWPVLTRGEWLALFPLAILLLQIAQSFVTSISTSLGWDGLLLWGLKAKAIYLSSHSASDALWQYLNADVLNYSHRDYPLTFPASEAWVFVWCGGVNEQMLKLIVPLFWTALLVILSVRLCAVLPPVVALLCVCLLTGAPLLDYLAHTGYADVPLLAFAGSAAAFAAESLRRESVRAEWLALLLAAGGATVKKEGLIFAALLVAGWLFVRLARRRWPDTRRLLWQTLVAAALVIGPYWLFLWRYRLPSIDFLPLGALTPAHLGRLSAVGYYALTQMMSAQVFGYGWFVIVGLALWCWRAWRNPAAALLLWLCASYLGFSVGVFVLSSWPDYFAHVTTALPRLLAHALPVAVLLVGHLWAARFESEVETAGAA